MADSFTTIVGNITRNPELRFTQAGKAVTSFGVAVNRRYQVDGDWKEDTSFFNVSAFGSLGENVAASLSKGDRVIVSGRLEQREYTTREGEKRSTVEVVADEVGPSLRWATSTVARTTGGSSAAAPAKAAAAVTAGAPDPFGPSAEPF